MALPLEERLTRLNQWFHRENDRPLLGFTREPVHPLRGYPGGRLHLPAGPYTADDLVVDDFPDDAVRLHEWHEELAGGDLIWGSAPFWGVPWMEASLGCVPVADFTTGSCRAHPPAGFSDNPVVPKFSPDNPWVRKMIEFAAALEKKGAGRFGVGVTLLRGISDLLSALYGGQDFIFRMIQSPDEVRRVVEQLTDYWIALGRHLLAELPLYHGGSLVFLYGLWCPGKTIWFQEDASALLSPALYEEFIRPADLKIAESFEHTVFHLHPARFMPVDDLLNGPVDVVEINVDSGGPTARGLCDLYGRVLERKPLFIWGCLTEDDLFHVIDTLPHKGLAINTIVDSREEADRLWAAFQQRFPQSVHEGGCPVR